MGFSLKMLPSRVTVWRRNEEANILISDGLLQPNYMHLFHAPWTHQKLHRGFYIALGPCRCKLSHCLCTPSAQFHEIRRAFIYPLNVWVSTLPTMPFYLIIQSYHGQLLLHVYININTMCSLAYRPLSSLLDDSIYSFVCDWLLLCNTQTC